MVGVLLVVGVHQLDGPAGVRERERHPGRRSAPGADQRHHVAGVGGGVLASPAVHVPPEREARAPQLVLAKLATAHLAVPRGLDRLRTEVDRLRQRGQIRVRPAGAERLVDRDAEQVRGLAGGHLAQQLAVLALLHIAVEVRHAAALLGAAIDREQPAVGELQSLALAAALQPVHEHRQRERLAGQHRPVQPPHVRTPRRVRDHDRLLDVAIDDHVVMRGLEVKARGRDLLPEPECRLAGEVAVAGRVELPQHLHSARRGASAGVVGPGRVEPRPQQPRDLLAVEQLGRHALRLELRAQRIDVGELLADRPTVRAHRPLQRPGRQPASPRPRQRRSRDALPGHQRHDHIAGDLYRRLRVGMQAQ